MPTYDYECTDCGYKFEYFQSMSDEVLRVCPECGGSLKRLVGGGLGVIFKGSGFYVTDNKSKSGSSHSGAGKASGAASASSSDSSGTSGDSSNGKSSPSGSKDSKVSGAGAPGSGKKEAVSTS